MCKSQPSLAKKHMGVMRGLRKGVEEDVQRLPKGRTGRSPKNSMSASARRCVWPLLLGSNQVWLGVRADPLWRVHCDAFCAWWVEGGLPPLPTQLLCGEAYQ